MNAEPYKTFLDKFVTQETEIEGYQKEMHQSRRRCKDSSVNWTRSSAP